MSYNDAMIIFFGQRARVICDRNCAKAWGINNRPRIDLDPNEPDDYAFLACTQNASSCHCGWRSRWRWR